MIRPSLREHIKCRWREFRREPSAFFWVIFMPILWMLGLGFAFSDHKQEIYHIGIVNEQTVNTHLQNDIMVRLKDIKGLVVEENNLETLDKEIIRGKIVLIAKLKDDQIIYEFDPSNPQGLSAKRFVHAAVEKIAGQKDWVPSQEVHRTVLGSRYIDFLVPGLLGLSIMTSSLFGVGMTIVSNRRENLLKRYLVTPMPRSDYLISHIIGRGLILSVEFSAILISGFLIFKFKVLGNIFNYFLFSCLGAAAFTAIALLCASRTKSLPMIAGISNVIMFPMMALSGVFFSKSNFPDWVLRVVNYLPLTVLNDGLRKIALESATLTDINFEIAALSCYLIIPTIIARYLFRWY